MELALLSLKKIRQGYENIELLWNTLLKETQLNLPAGDRVMRLVCRALFENCGRASQGGQCRDLVATIWRYEYQYGEEMLKNIDLGLRRGRLVDASATIDRAVEVLESADTKLEILTAVVKRLECENRREIAWKYDAMGDSYGAHDREIRFKTMLGDWTELYETIKNNGMPETFCLLEDLIEKVITKQDRWKQTGLENRFQRTTYLNLYGYGKSLDFGLEVRPPLFGKPQAEWVEIEDSLRVISSKWDAMEKKSGRGSERKTAMLGLRGYNEKWNTLDPYSPAVPYPTHTHVAKDISSSKLTASGGGERLQWTAEEMTIANIQAFFLVELGIRPRYWLYQRQIKMGFSEVTPLEKIQTLKRQLKKERFRWHPDKMGARIDGKDDPMAKTVHLAVQRLYDECMHRTAKN